MCPLSPQFPTSLGSIRTFATSPCPSDRPCPWAEEFQKIDTHLPNDQSFHIFGTFCQSEGSLQKCDQCFRTWNMLAESDCYVCQHLSIPCTLCLIFPCPLLQCPSVSAVTEQRQSNEKSQPLRLGSLSIFQFVDTHQQMGFQLRFGQSEQHCTNLDSVAIAAMSISFCRRGIAAPAYTLNTVLQSRHVSCAPEKSLGCPSKRVSTPTPVA